MHHPSSITKFLLTAISVMTVVTAGLVTVPPINATEPAEITIFAAASTTNAISEINALFEAQGYGKTVVAFASSSTLAKQIDNGAPADIFLSANAQWMDYLTQKGMIEPHTRFNLLGNDLVMIAAADSFFNEIRLIPGFPLAAILGKGRLAMGDPTHVPVGIYGKQALVCLGVWDAVATKTAPAKDVRSALVLVERGETPLGMVYATDAAISANIRVLGVIPKNCQPAISYPVAIIAGRLGKGPQRYLKFLKTPQARITFEKYGFSVP